jgi:hypothetical protein
VQGKAPKDIHSILTEILEQYAPSCATVKTWVAQFKRSDFSTCDTPHPGRPQTVTTPEIIDQIQDTILAKSIGEQLDNSRERVASTILEGLDMRKLSAKWVPKRLNVDIKTSTVPDV